MQKQDGQSKPCPSSFFMLIYWCTAAEDLRNHNTNEKDYIPAPSPLLVCNSVCLFAQMQSEAVIDHSLVEYTEAD